MKRATIYVVLVCILSPFLLAPARGNPQEDVKAKAEGALKNFNKNVPEGLAQLRALGAPAVPFILDYIREGHGPIIKIILLSFVSSTQGKEADDAVLSLLWDKDPSLRGYAVTAIGARKLKAGVPRLVELLSDKGVYNHVVVMDGEDYDVLVRDNAVEALESINGMVLEKKGSNDKKAKAWLRWWQRQQKSKSAVNS
jgi:hypothetical protein